MQTGKDGARTKRPRAERIKRRLAVRFTCTGTETQLRSGYTTDISESGLFVHTLRPPALGTQISIGLVLRGGQEIKVRAVVARLVVPPPQFARLIQSGFGARFAGGGLSLTELELSAPALERSR